MALKEAEIIEVTTGVTRAEISGCIPPPPPDTGPKPPCIPQCLPTRPACTPTLAPTCPPTFGPPPPGPPKPN